MRMKSIFLRGSIFGLLLLVIIVASYVSILKQYEAMKSSGYTDWTMTQRPFYSKNDITEFLKYDDNAVKLKLWWEGLSGNIEVKIIDEKGNIHFSKKEKDMRREYDIPLGEGKYTLDITISNFTGAVALDYENITTITKLPKDRYRLIPADPSKGFHWDYLLFTPDKVTENHILVIPNNSGSISDNLHFHKEKAKQLILWKSKLAEELGVPLLVPIFPRSKDNLYTHALDRGTILTEAHDLKRLDLQLIAMLKDAKTRLSQQGIQLDDKILMSGFSASGDFTDRFTFLHPDIIKAASIGGCDLMLPYKELAGENLPYPLGIYDYEAILGRKFDLNSFKEVFRYLYKGSMDEGGWVRLEKNGEAGRYTWKEYYDTKEKPQLMEVLKEQRSPIYVDGELTNMDEKQIMFRVHNGKILVDRFLSTQDIFKKLKLERSVFVVYDGVGHEITNEIEKDELEFFRKVLKD